jgi:hypothetical protein
MIVIPRRTSRFGLPRHGSHELRRDAFERNWFVPHHDVVSAWRNARDVRTNARDRHASSLPARGGPLYHRIIAVVALLFVSTVCVAQTPCFSFTRLSRPSSGPYAVAGTSGDFNHDSRTDLVVYYSTGRGLEVFLGSLTGALVPAGTYFSNASAGVTAVDAADLNADGHLDLIASVGTDLRRLTGNGDGTFADGPVVPVAANASDVEVADLTGDGIPDVVASLRSGHLLLLRGLGGGTLAPPVSIAFLGLTSIAIGDYNSDGLLDLAGIDGSSVLQVIFSQGNGSFESPAGYGLLHLTSTAPDAIVATDYDHDGDVDVLIAQSSTGTSIVRNNGNKTFTDTAELAPLTPSYSLALADFNGDGTSDVIVSGDRGFNILLANGDGTYAAPRFVRTTPAGSFGVTAGSFITGDFRGSGRTDVALGIPAFGVGITHTIDVFLNDCGPPALPALSPLAAFLALLALAAAGWWTSRG